MDESYEDNSSPQISISEINAHIPRRVRLDGNSVGAVGFGLLIFLAGLALLVWLSLGTVKNLRIQSTLLQNGRVVNGTVTANSGNRGGTNVQYTFVVDSVQYWGHAEMSSDHYGVPDDPHLIPIRYLPADPLVNQPVNWKWVSVWDVFPFLLLVAMTAVGAKVLITALRLTNLARNGVVVVGKVTGCAPKKRLFTVFYVFTSRAKEKIEGSCDLLEEREDGTAIPIVYLPSNPKRNTRYPVAGFRTSE